MSFLEKQAKETPLSEEEWKKYQAESDKHVDSLGKGVLKSLKRVGVGAAIGVGAGTLGGAALGHYLSGGDLRPRRNLSEAAKQISSNWRRTGAAVGALGGTSFGAGAGGGYDKAKTQKQYLHAHERGMQAAGRVKALEQRKGLSRLLGKQKTVWRRPDSPKPEAEKKASLETDLRNRSAQLEVAFEKLSSYNDSPGAPEESAEDSRKRRLAELLKKREHSGTATGSASPNPPKGP